MILALRPLSQMPASGRTRPSASPSARMGRAVVGRRALVQGGRRSPVPPRAHESPWRRPAGFPRPIEVAQRADVTRPLAAGCHAGSAVDVAVPPRGDRSSARPSCAGCGCPADEIQVSAAFHRAPATAAPSRRKPAKAWARAAGQRLTTCQSWLAPPVGALGEVGVVCAPAGADVDEPVVATAMCCVSCPARGGVRPGRVGEAAPVGRRPSMTPSATTMSCARRNSHSPSGPQPDLPGNALVERVDDVAGTGVWIDEGHAQNRCAVPLGWYAQHGARFGGTGGP